MELFAYGDGYAAEVQHGDETSACRLSGGCTSGNDISADYVPQGFDVGASIGRGYNRRFQLRNLRNATIANDRRNL